MTDSFLADTQPSYYFQRMGTAPLGDLPLFAPHSGMVSGKYKGGEEENKLYIAQKVLLWDGTLPPPVPQDWLTTSDTDQ